MMLLADIGNSRLKWAQLHDGVLTPGTPIELAGCDTSAPLERAWGSLEPPRRALLAAVAPAERTSEVAAWLQRRWAIEAQRVTPRARACGLVSHYDPAQLGVDRWLAVLGAWAALRADCCVIDCGTALTADAVTAGGEHLGGLIMPGTELQLRALSTGTGGVRTGDDGTPDIVARSTADAVRGGALWSQAALVDTFRRRISQREGRNFGLVVTGGAAQAIIPRLSDTAEYRAHLVLEGMAVLAQES